MKQAVDIEKLVTQEIERISQQDLVDTIRRLLVPVRSEARGWDYGEPDQTYPCWIVAEHRPSNTALRIASLASVPIVRGDSYLLRVRTSA